MQILFKAISFEQKSKPTSLLHRLTVPRSMYLVLRSSFIVVPKVVLTYRLHKPYIYWMQPKTSHYCNV